jgi:hypothetical protein
MEWLIVLALVGVMILLIQREGGPKGATGAFFEAIGVLMVWLVLILAFTIFLVVIILKMMF